MVPVIIIISLYIGYFIGMHIRKRLIIESLKEYKKLKTELRLIFIEKNKIFPREFVGEKEIQIIGEIIERIKTKY